ncbi:MAG: hypothetical protein HY819_04725 [Acidobacteria bacterium]|nr:hypothetical protein [Acidobacteriota bacterium]
MSIWLEDKINDALLSVNWEQVGEGVSSKYFTVAGPNYVKINTLTAAWLARFISNHVNCNSYEAKNSLTDQTSSIDVDDEFDKYSLEVIATYLEDHGYTVSFPD